MWSKERAHEFYQEIQDTKSPHMKYKDSRPIYDLKHMIETSVELYGDNAAFWTKDTHDDPYRKITYKEMKKDVDSLGTALIGLGLKDKRIGVIGENCYEWAISYLAVTCGAGVVVPLDKELSSKEIKGFMKEAEIEAVIYHHKSKKHFTDAKDEVPTLKYCINMHKNEEGDDHYFKDLLKDGAGRLADGDKSYYDVNIDPNEMGVLLFTSGTTGTSKGVMLSHGNLCCDLMIAPVLLKVNDWDVFFSVLPLHHTYACTDDFLMPLYKGASVAYCEGLKYIVKNLEEAKPTMFLGVPAIFENLYSKIWQNARKSGKDKLLKTVIKVNRVTKKIGIDLGKIFFKQITALFGGRMRMMISGGAAIDPAIIQGIRDFGIMAVQGYGLTECAPICALNPDTAPKNDSAGFIPPGLEGKIDNPDEDGIGEFCTRGDNVMLGYYKNPEATAEVIKDGWFHTGDLAYIDDENYVYLTGRIKNVIVAKNGKNIFPEELEYLLGRLDIVKESMVFGKASERKEDETVVVAGIFPDEERLEEILGNDYNEKEVEDLLWKEVDEINKELPMYKRIKHIILRHEEFEKNTSKKIKRFVDSNKEG